MNLEAIEAPVPLHGSKAHLFRKIADLCRHSKVLRVPKTKVLVGDFTSIDAILRARYAEPIECTNVIECGSREIANRDLAAFDSILDTPQTCWAFSSQVERPAWVRTSIAFEGRQHTSEAGLNYSVHFRSADRAQSVARELLAGASRPYSRWYHSQLIKSAYLGCSILISELVDVSAFITIRSLADVTLFEIDETAPGSTPCLAELAALPTAWLGKGRTLHSALLEIKQHLSLQNLEGEAVYSRHGQLYLTQLRPSVEQPLWAISPFKCTTEFHDVIDARAEGFKNFYADRIDSGATLVILDGREHRLRANALAAAKSIRRPTLLIDRMKSMSDHVLLALAESLNIDVFGTIGEVVIEPGGVGIYSLLFGEQAQVTIRGESSAGVE